MALLPPIVRFQASATEQEIWRGALCVPDAPEHVVACFRGLTNLKDFTDARVIKEFVDVDEDRHMDVTLGAAQEQLQVRCRRGWATPMPFATQTLVWLNPAMPRDNRRSTSPSRT